MISFETHPKVADVMTALYEDHGIVLEGDGLDANPNRWGGVDVTDFADPHDRVVRLHVDDGDVGFALFTQNMVLVTQARFDANAPSEAIAAFVACFIDSWLDDDA